KYVTPRLIAKAYRRLGRVDLRLLGFTPRDLGLVQLVLQHLERGRLVLVLRALLLRRSHQSARNVSDANRRARLVDVLATGAGCAINVYPEIVFLDLDVDLFVDDRIHEDR